MTHAADHGLDERSLVFVCQGPSCGERGGRQLAQWLRSWIGGCEARFGLRVCETTCLDHCPTGPNVAVQEESGVRTGVVGEAAARALFAELHEARRPVTGS